MAPELYKEIKQKAEAKYQSYEDYIKDLGFNLVETTFVTLLNI